MIGKTDGLGCYWAHPKTGNTFKCFDGVNMVCARCCVEKCPREEPELFERCTAANHPTWTTHSTTAVPQKLICLEGYWQAERLFNRSTVQPFLDGLAALGSQLKVGHRRVDSIEALTRVATTTLWEDEESWNCPVFYFGFHGRAGRIQVGDGEAGIRALSQCFKGYGGYPHILYFGTCATLGGKAGARLAESLLRHAGSRAVVGFAEDVPWMQGMLIDLLFMEKFYSDPDPWANLRGIYDEVMSELSFAKDLGFTMVTP